MKTSKVIVLVTIVGLIIISLIYRQHYLNNNVEYQMKMLESDNIDAKIRAISFLSSKRYIPIIPVLINNIDNQERGEWEADPKGG